VDAISNRVEQAVTEAPRPDGGRAASFEEHHGPRRDSGAGWREVASLGLTMSRSLPAFTLARTGEALRVSPLGARSGTKRIDSTRLALELAL